MFRRFGAAFILLPSLLSVSCTPRAPFDGKSVAELEHMVRGSSSIEQSQGAFGLSKLGRAAAPAVPALIHAARGEPNVRQNVALALGKIGPEARDAVGVLVELLRDPEWPVRRQAALALGEIGEASALCLGGLERLKKDPNNQVKKAAEQTLAKLKPARR